MIFNSKKRKNSIGQFQGVLFLLFCIISIDSSAQQVFQHVNNTNIYEFIDELANEKIVEINTVVKPYSRKFIFQKLSEAKLKMERLNSRQKNDLDFYFKDYIKESEDFTSPPSSIEFKKSNKRLDAFFYRDSLFTLSINPVFGYAFYKNQNGSLHHKFSGGEMFGYYKNWGFYANLRDNFESKRMNSPVYLTQRMGSEYKNNLSGGVDYSEMRGGITYSNKWVSVGLIKDHFVWGNNYNGSVIFSGRTPSFAQFFIKAKPVDWFEFNYVHGYLVSGIVDSVNSYTINKVNRLVYQQKLLSANFFTVKPVKNLFISAGNSVVYSNMANNPVYLIPFFFYKSLDHTYSPNGNNGGQNAQMFLDISSRNIKHVHLYSSVFIDEISFSRMMDKTKQSNLVSFKLGVRSSNLFFKNLFFTAEYTRTNPIVYKHYITTTTFSSNDFNLGHYLKDNSREFFLSLMYKPISRMVLRFSNTNAQVGNNYPDIRKPNLVWGLPFLKDIKWSNTNYELALKYEIKSDLFLNASYNYSNVKGDDVKLYTPEYLIGKQQTYSFGLNFGF